jgi:hypothetical protein
MRLIATLAVAALVSASAAYATEPAATSHAGAAAAASAAQPSTEVAGLKVPAKICRKVTGTGSRVSREKICKTQEEWRAYAKRRAGRGIACEGDSECNRGTSNLPTGGG